MDLAGPVALVFALLGLGYALAWGGVLREGTGEALGDFVITIAIPALLFRTMSGADFAGADPLPLWSVYFAAIAITWALASFTVRARFGRDARSGVVAGLSASFSNLVLLGLPTIAAVFGPAGVETLSLLVAVHLPVMMAASVILHDVAVRRDGAGAGGLGPAAFLRRFLAGLASNPIMIGIGAGLLWRLSPVPLPGLVETIVDALADIAGTLALIALGMSLRRFGVRRNLSQGVAMAAFKVVLMPAITLGIALLVGLPPRLAEVAVVCAAMPTGVNPYLIAGRFGTGEAIASNAMLLSTAAAFATLTGWLWVARAVYG